MLGAPISGRERDARRGRGRSARASARRSLLQDVQPQHAASDSVSRSRLRSPDILDDSHPIGVERAAPLQQLTKPFPPRGDHPLRLSRPTHRPRPRNGSARVDRSRSSPFGLSFTRMNPMKRTPGGHFSVGAMPAPIRSRQDVLDGDGRHLREVSQRRQNQSESARSRQGQSTTRANSATPHQTLSLKNAEVVMKTSLP